ncbi:unnamed protein product [Mytilus edulis]|uniref:Uncharacterized protein n=1 Tax=Mytilus edulis TaxID=6550 RepID=A0A8S3SPK1_MYTED|nr:unnamed protein product [Mytilus edulis]
MENTAEERINIALETLKKELVEMRSLDVELMKQLLSINDTIQKLTKGHTMTRTQSCKSRISTKRSQRLQHIKDRVEKPIRRLQSTPSFCRLSSTDSTSNFEKQESPNSMDDATFYFEESDEDLYVKDGRLARYNSMSCIAPLDDTQTNCYEEILRANIKVWKSSKVEESDC